MPSNRRHNHIGPINQDSIHLKLEANTDLLLMLRSLQLTASLCHEQASRSVREKRPD
jgi:hypothetical protein